MATLRIARHRGLLIFIQQDRAGTYYADITTPSGETLYISDSYSTIDEAIAQAKQWIDQHGA